MMTPAKSDNAKALILLLIEVRAEALKLRDDPTLWTLLSRSILRVARTGGVAPEDLAMLDP